METFEIGDIVTYRLHGDDYGLAHILYIEELTTFSHYHLAVLDAVLKAEEGGVDSYGVGYERSFTLGDEENAPVVIDHIVLNLEAFNASFPSKVGSREVTEEDMKGYPLWLIGAREQLLKRGLIHAEQRVRDQRFEDDQEDEEYEDDDYIDEAYANEESGDVEGDELNMPPALDASDMPESIEEEIEHLEREEGEESLYRELLPGEKQGGSAEEKTVELRAWHSSIFDRPLGDALFQMRDELAREEYAGTKLVGYINAYFEGAGEAIDELITRFVEEGDYAAGHELMAFGDPAADKLAAHLQDGMDPQVAEDITNILCDMGSLRAYEHIANFFLQHEGNVDDPLNYAAARGFCYAVMLTGGTPAPLKAHVDRLDDITNPELAHDVASAKDAVQTASQLDLSEPGMQGESSTDPFAKLGGR